MSSTRAAGRQARTTFNHSLLFLAVCEALSYSSLALAADTAGSDNPLDTVVVIGNRGQARTLAESTAPVDVI
ncbi:hypothetical protein, partial [Pseudomonas gingeri]|uniref:hypothetical protein n=1 Tax=Pseudomonas gingeri TaxID=117681 RepID=UPI0015C0FD0A